MTDYIDPPNYDKPAKVVEVITKTYIAFMLDYSTNMPTREIVERNPRWQAENAPEDVYAFYYYNVVTVLVQFGDEDPAELTSPELNLSPSYYINGVVIDLKEFKATDYERHDAERIWKFVDAGDLTHVVHHRSGAFTAYDANEDFEVISTH